MPLYKAQTKTRPFLLIPEKLVAKNNTRGTLEFFWTLIFSDRQIWLNHVLDESPLCFSVGKPVCSLSLFFVFCIYAAALCSRDLFLVVFFSRVCSSVPFLLYPGTLSICARCVVKTLTRLEDGREEDSDRQHFI